MIDKPKRKHVIGVRVTEKELAALKRGATAAAQDLATFMRDTALARLAAAGKWVTR